MKRYLSQLRYLTRRSWKSYENNRIYGHFKDKIAGKVPASIWITHVQEYGNIIIDNQAVLKLKSRHCCETTDFKPCFLLHYGPHTPLL